MCLHSDGSFVAQKLLWEAKVAQSCLQHKKLPQSCRAQSIKAYQEVPGESGYDRAWLFGEIQLYRTDEKDKNKFIA